MTPRSSPGFACFSAVFVLASPRLAQHDVPLGAAARQGATQEPRSASSRTARRSWIQPPPGGRSPRSPTGWRPDRPGVPRWKARPPTWDRWPARSPWPPTGPSGYETSWSHSARIATRSPAPAWAATSRSSSRTATQPGCCWPDRPRCTVRSGSRCAAAGDERAGSAAPCAGKPPAQASRTSDRRWPRPPLPRRVRRRRPPPISG